ncbi:MAG: molybdenum cofactor guanylyltransferase [Deltaproteobacteria bacterium]|nr:molybdenum cofactor guanylyltransferase [Deltaproteobacteria bacterium]
MKTAKPNGCAVTRSAGTDKKNRILGVILAGGRSSRMGRDKATLPFGGTRLIDRVATRLRAAIEEDRSATAAAAAADPILVSGSVDGYACVADRTPGLGPIGGVESVLRHLVARAAGEDAAAALLVVPVDMPSLTSKVLGALIREWRKSGSGFDGAAFYGRELPVIFALSAKVRDVVEDLCKPATPAEMRSVRALLGRLTMLAVDAENIPKREFLNANTPGDLAGFHP